ncbi:DNA-3-methyladenine glycosylase 2 family protein [Alteromonas sp. a30]|uniref:DNA-3-methyladenine glycosylase 2 family protein n=1 Tax=Alteromonas sp. a30 TaxID=2730917 RepID=UPI0022828EC2|nr:Ada metal-binding domain-containing protein [Alteromonas sp. a30]MCY7294997.1 DNA-3-methyladenine glycosylase 2 family protein [Alteromonas sp. a30]
MLQFTPEQYKSARKSRDPRFDGRFFVAVKTTGIFCRNVCPVKLPKEDNVVYFDLAAQALQAGFRPCLRCRPDSAPGSCAWQGVETTLHRAMRLLKQHPDMELSVISEKLGISDRYLRKRFQLGLGVSPKHFQLTEQLLFAKRLLHETQLSIEDIAHSCGFNSARRLQDNMQNHFRLTPSEVRKMQHTQHEFHQITIPCRAPYNWPQVRDFLALRAISGVEEVTESYYSRHFELSENNVDCRGFFFAEYQATSQSFNVNIQLDTPSSLGAVLRNIKRMLDTDTDSQLIANHMIRAGLSENQIVEGLRLPGVWDVFEAGVRAIMGQQVSIKAATKHVCHLVENCAHEVNGQLYFPRPSDILASDLSFLKMPQARKQTLHNLAQYVSENGRQSDPENWLPLKGIGPWTVAYAKMRGLSDPDIWLSTDLIVKKQREKHPINDEHVIPWRSYLTFQLWSMA